MDRQKADFSRFIRSATPEQIALHFQLDEIIKIRRSLEDAKEIMIKRKLLEDIKAEKYLLHDRSPLGKIHVIKKEPIYDDGTGWTLCGFQGRAYRITEMPTCKGCIKEFESQMIKLAYVENRA